MIRISGLIKYLERTYNADYPVDSTYQLQSLFDDIVAELYVAKTLTPNQVEKYIAKNERKIGDREQHLSLIKDKVSVLNNDDLKVLSRALITLYHLTIHLSNWDTRKENLREWVKTGYLTDKKLNLREYDYDVCHVENYYKQVKKLYKGA